MTQTPVVEVVGAVIYDNGEYLACRRRVERGGLWEFPGGKVERGEDPSAALRREIREELGIEISVGEVIDVTMDAARRFRLTTYAATLTDIRPTTSTDHDRLEWLSPDELDDVAWSPADRPTVARLQRRSNP